MFKQYPCIFYSIALLAILHNHFRIYIFTFSCPYFHVSTLKNTKQHNQMDSSSSCTGAVQILLRCLLQYWSIQLLEYVVNVQINNNQLLKHTYYMYIHRKMKNNVIFLPRLPFDTDGCANDLYYRMKRS